MLPAGRTLRARRFAPVHLAPLGSIYDIQRAVADEATKPIYYESRIAKLTLNAAALPKLDAEFEEITEGEELTKKEKLKSKWAALEALVGDPKRIALIAADLVTHFENLGSRQSARLQALQAALNKKSGTHGKSPEQIDAAIRQLVSKAITTEGEIIDPECRDSAPKVRNVIAQGEAP